MTLQAPRVRRVRRGRRGAGAVPRRRDVAPCDRGGGRVTAPPRAAAEGVEDDLRARAADGVRLAAEVGAATVAPAFVFDTASPPPAPRRRWRPGRRRRRRKATAPTT